MECCHNDGGHTNNHLDNLRWDTKTSNQADRVRHGTAQRGKRNHQAKLTEAQVLAIRADPRLQREIATEHGVSHKTISNIKHRRRWGWLPG
jgi:hypothetical protein